jgi:hypothetical protein
MTHSWQKRNLFVLSLFAPILVLTGALGLILPPNPRLMSNAGPYDIFHIVAGSVGIGLVLARWARGAARFNFVFGLIDLWQLLAGLTGLFPAALFALQPADHIVHLVIGLPLTIVGWLGVRARE